MNKIREVEDDHERLCLEIVCPVVGHLTDLRSSEIGSSDGLNYLRRPFQFQFELIINSLPRHEILNQRHGIVVRAVPLESVF